jgi:hypothetical protein
MIARGLAKDDPAAALRWADSLPGVLKTGGTRAALTAWAETQPEEAYKYCIANGWSDAGTFEGIFASWGESDPEAAAAAAATVSGDRARAGAISSAVDAWAGQSRDPEVVGQWIASLPGQEDRNLANSALASAIDADQPKLAWERVMQISNPDDRRGVLASTFASLVANQPAQASAALDQASNLTAEERGRLSRMLDSRSR